MTDLLIMSRDDVAGRWENGTLTVTDEKKLPLYLARTLNVPRWLDIRSVDFHRSNSRLLRKALRLSEKDDIDVVLSVNAATVTDTYWVKPIGSETCYADICFDNDYFSTLALKGSYGSFNRASRKIDIKTPELTNIGSFEKCWKLIDGAWYMYKRASHGEMFSELFAFVFGSALGFNMAEYKRGNSDFIITKDFTGGSVNFEPAYSFMGDNEDYEDVVAALKTIAPHTIDEYVKIIFLDTLIANPDRHTFNFGLLRGIEGDILSLAPNFDNNLALIARGYPHGVMRHNDIMVKAFNRLLDSDPSLSEFIPPVTEELVRSSIGETGMKVRTQLIVDFIMNAYRQIKYTRG